MKNFVPLGTGNSRLMKSGITAGTTWEQALAMLIAGTFPYDTGQLNAAGISQQGDPLNKNTLLKDATAQSYGLGTDAVPDDVFSKLSRFHSGLGNEYLWAKYGYVGQKFQLLGYVNSPDESAYPPSVSDGYSYTALGQLGHLGDKVRIATGSYTGTGKYGRSNPCSLTFDFEPTSVTLIGYGVPLNGGYRFMFLSEEIPFAILTETYTQYNGFSTSDGTNYSYGKKSGNTIYWYNTSSADKQLNNSSYIYFFKAERSE